SPPGEGIRAAGTGPPFIGFATPKVGRAPGCIPLTPFFRPNALIYRSWASLVFYNRLSSDMARGRYRGLVNRLRTLILSKCASRGARSKAACWPPAFAFGSTVGAKEGEAVLGASADRLSRSAAHALTQANATPAGKSMR